MPSVLISDKMADLGLELLRHSGIEVDNRQGLKAACLQKALRDNDGVFVRSETRITAELLGEPGRLRVIVRGGVGCDTIDVEAAARMRIPVLTTPNGSTVSVAEHTIGMIISLARNFAAADASVREGRWERSRFTGTQLAGRTLGIIGMGRIGSEVGRRARALDMKVLGFDPLLQQSRALASRVELVATLTPLLERCDFLTVHTPFTAETMNMIGSRELKMMKKGARVVNCARGGIINELALAEALASGHIAGAGVDVFEQEPPPSDHPLFRAPNVLFTPHIGASTEEAQTSIAIEAAQLLIEFLQMD